MTRIERWGPIGVASALAFAIGFLVARWQPLQPDTAWNFGGAVVGAALTVFGALWVVTIQQSSDVRQARATMLDLLNDLKARLNLIRTPPEGAKPEDREAARLAAVLFFAEGLKSAQEARSWFIPDNAAAVRALAHIDSIRIEAREIREACRPAVFYGGPVDLERYLRMPEARIDAAIAEMQNQPLPAAIAET